MPPVCECVVTDRKTGARLAQDLARFHGAPDGEHNRGATTGGGRVGRLDVDPRFGEPTRDSGERTRLVAQAHDEDGCLADAILGAAQGALGFAWVVDDQADLAAPASRAGGQADDGDAGVGPPAGERSGAGHGCASSSTVRLDPYTTRSAVRRRLSGCDARCTTGSLRASNHPLLNP